MHITGESLMNDGSSYVFFSIASSLWYEQLNLPQNLEITTVSGYIVYFFRMSLGGTTMGAVFGFALLVLLWELDRRLERQYDILQVVLGLTAAYLCFYVCDALLDMSGIMAVVACGLVVNRFGKGMINDEELMHSYLSLVGIIILTYFLD
ncbi:MAG: CPA1 family monovalent cation:H+ antiporter [Bacillariaceae sp.]|jgi:CPA1 family monovalent cation:H+ antiporter